MLDSEIGCRVWNTVCWARCCLGFLFTLDLRQLRGKLIELDWHMLAVIHRN